MTSKEIRNRVAVLSDVFLEAGFRVEIEHVAGGDRVVIRDNSRVGVGSFDVSGKGIQVNWEAEPDVIFGTLKKAGAKNVSERRGGTITPKTKVYTADAWWRGNDAFVRIVTLSKEETGSLIDEAVLEEAQGAADAEIPRTSAEDYFDMLDQSDVSEERLSDCIEGDFEEAASELAEDGIWYPIDER